MHVLLTFLTAAIGVALFAAAGTAQQCLGLASIERIRGSVSAGAIANTGAHRRIKAATSDVAISASRALSLGVRHIREEYLDVQGSPWEATGIGGHILLEWSAARAPHVTMCPTIAFENVRSNVADWGSPEEWARVRFLPGFAASYARQLSNDIRLIPFASAAFVLESFDQRQPNAEREQRAYAVAELGAGLIFWEVMTLRLSVSTPIGQDRAYPGPYTLRSASAGVAWSRKRFAGNSMPAMRSRH